MSKSGILRMPAGLRRVVLYVAGVVILYIVSTYFLHSVAKLQSDLSRGQVGFDDQAMVDHLREQAQPRGQQNDAPPSPPHEVQYGSSHITTGQREQASEPPKTLFNEGKGVPAFQFKTETVMEHGVNTIKRDIGRASNHKDGEETSKFGLPLTTSRARKNLGGTFGVVDTKPKPIETESHTTTTTVETATDVWSRGLLHKLACLKKGCGGVFLYHVRKAAGTSIRDVLEQACKRWHVSLFETEGLSLDKAFLSYGGSSSKGPRGGALLSVTTLRDPVERAISMYWYEHVGWWDGIQKKTEKCHTLADWVATWRDNSEWKASFMLKNPRSVYVEIENYYVKMLTGWTGEHVDGPLTEAHLVKAKKILDTFDVVLLTEWMEDATQIDALNALFPGRSTIATKHMLRGDKKAKDRLHATLAPDEEDVKAELKKINSLDMQLWDHAQSIVARRLRAIPALVKQAAGMAAAGTTRQCGTRVRNLPKLLVEQLGIHQPPGHKAPL